MSMGSTATMAMTARRKPRPAPPSEHAISLAASGDTIQIAAATYGENLSIPFNLTLNGAKAATTIIDGTDTTNVFTVGAGISLTLSNLTIKNGVGYSGGGGVDNSGTLTVNNSNFYVNTALTGGAILNTGTANISKTTFSGNSPYFSGHSASCGAIDNRSAMTITASTFYNNYANNNFTSGGAICNGGTLTIAGSTFSTNSSQGTTGATAARFIPMRGPSPLRTVPSARTAPRRAEEPSTAKGEPSRSAIRLLATTPRLSAAAGLSATREARF